MSSFKMRVHPHMQMTREYSKADKTVFLGAGCWQMSTRPLPPTLTGRLAAINPFAFPLFVFCPLLRGHHLHPLTLGEATR